uniref:Uncharacterized protein n=1 Tax=uncultured bacterium pUR16A2 TaxID=1204710 RepID=R9QZL8_9BACT|nr:hypothetical protein [uncultured bacterium pUR16A2]
MKYFIRSLKYFLYISIILILILAALAAFGLVSTDINVLFRDGYKSLLKIALMFFGVSLVYPKFGYTKRGAVLPGEYSEIRDGIISFMESRGYRLESEENENLTFRMTSSVKKILRVGEDRITMTRDMAGYVVEGPSKDIISIVYGLQERLNRSE